MRNFHNLKGQEAINKLKAMVEEIKVCMFCTQLDEQPFSTRPMIIQEVDTNGDIWFLSSDVSDKNVELKIDENMQLLFAGAKSNQYLSVFGSGMVYKDKKIIEKKSKHSVKAWIEKGTEDPNISFIRFVPKSGMYWDSEYGELKF